MVIHDQDTARELFVEPYELEGRTPSNEVQFDVSSYQVYTLLFGIRGFIASVLHARVAPN
eukprot:scaffold484458_cov14-Prasinocladus_malaysianus.AAC.1